MRNGFALLAAGALFLSPVLAERLSGQAGGGRQGGAGGDVQSVVGGGAAQDGARGQGGRQGQGGGQGRGGQGRGGGRGPAAPAPAAPRNSAGRVLLQGADPKDKGVWLPTLGITAPAADVTKMPWMPWSKGVYTYRQTNELEPHTRCKASGVTRPFLTPYGVEFVELPNIDRIFVFDIGGPHTFRTIYMDGRGHPKDLKPTYYGHNIGWWEGDTLVVDAVGFVESFWLDRRGIPHTDKLHTIEKFTRQDKNTMKYEVTIDDPGAYTAPFTGGFNLRWEAGTELFEYVCQQANYASELMVGAGESVDRTTSFVP